MTLNVANAQVILESATPIIVLAGTEGSAVCIGLRENAGKLEIGICTKTGTAPDEVITWVSTLHSMQATGNIVIPIYLAPVDDDGDKEAAASTWDKTIFAVPTGQAYTVTKISVSPDGNIGQATNYMTLTVYNRGTDGNGSTAIVAEVYDAGAAVNDHVLTTMGTLANTSLTAGQSLSIAKTVGGSGQAWPGGLVLLELTRTA